MKRKGNMELKDYISETIKQIVQGVKTAQLFAVENGAVINGSRFRVSSSSNTNSLVLMDNGDGSIVQIIEFDIAIPTQESENSKGGVGIFVGTIGAGLHGNTGFQNTS
jgi:hypothetical protein